MAGGVGCWAGMSGSSSVRWMWGVVLWSGGGGDPPPHGKTLSTAPPPKECWAMVREHKTRSAQSAEMWLISGLQDHRYLSVNKDAKMPVDVPLKKQSSVKTRRYVSNQRHAGFTGPPPCVTFRLVVAPLRGPGRSPVLPFACCVGSLRSVGRCGQCSCWCRFRVCGAPSLVCWGCAGCGEMCRLRVSGAQ